MADPGELGGRGPARAWRLMVTGLSLETPASSRSASTFVCCAAVRVHFSEASSRREPRLLEGRHLDSVGAVRGIAGAAVLR